jgi:hypothetical protein
VKAAFRTHADPDGITFFQIREGNWSGGRLTTTGNKHYEEKQDPPN